MFNFLEIKKLLSTKDKIYLNLKNFRNKKLEYPFYRNLKNILKGQLKNRIIYNLHVVSLIISQKFQELWWIN